MMLSEVCIPQMLGLQANITMSGALSSTLSPGTYSISQCFSLNTIQSIRNSFWICSIDSISITCLLKEMCLLNTELHFPSYESQVYCFPV